MGEVGTASEPRAVSGGFSRTENEDPDAHTITRRHTAARVRPRGRTHRAARAQGCQVCEELARCAQAPILKFAPAAPASFPHASASRAAARVGDYRRIVIVGHSLGSVIGCDVLTHAWPRYNTVRTPRKRASRAWVAELHALIDDSDTDRVRRKQRCYLEELQELGNEWLVTDFVTLGSPCPTPS